MIVCVKEQSERKVGQVVVGWETNLVLAVFSLLSFGFGLRVFRTARCGYTVERARRYRWHTVHPTTRTRAIFSTCRPAKRRSTNTTGGKKNSPKTRSDCTLHVIGQHAYLYTRAHRAVIKINPSPPRLW